MNITEPDTNDRQTVIVQLDIPIRFYLHGIRPAEEYKRIALEDLRCKASTVFEHIALLGFLAQSGNLDRSDLPDILDVLGNYGKGLMEATEIVEMEFERKEKSAAESVLDLSAMSTKDLETDDLDTLASHLSAAMKSPLMPKHLYNVIADELTEIPIDSDSTEWILANLKSQAESEQ